MKTHIMENRFASFCRVWRKSVSTTAGVSGCGVRFNRQLHPDERQWAKDNVKQFAQFYNDKTGQDLMAGQAQNLLLTNGYRLVDSAASKGTGGDAAVVAFVSQNAGANWSTLLSKIITILYFICCICLALGVAFFFAIYLFSLPRGLEAEPVGLALVPVGGGIMFFGALRTWLLRRPCSTKYGVINPLAPGWSTFVNAQILAGVVVFLFGILVNL